MKFSKETIIDFSSRDAIAQFLRETRLRFHHCHDARSIQMLDYLISSGKRYIIPQIATIVSDGLPGAPLPERVDGVVLVGKHEDGFNLDARYIGHFSLDDKCRVHEHPLPEELVARSYFPERGLALQNLFLAIPEMLKSHVRDYLTGTNPSPLEGIFEVQRRFDERYIAITTESFSSITSSYPSRRR